MFTVWLPTWNSMERFWNVCWLNSTWSILRVVNPSSGTAPRHTALSNMVGFLKTEQAAHVRASCTPWRWDCDRIFEEQCFAEEDRVRDAHSVDLETRIWGPGFSGACAPHWQGFLGNNVDVKQSHVSPQACFL